MSGLALVPVVSLELPLNGWKGCRFACVSELLASCLGLAVVCTIQRLWWRSVREQKTQFRWSWTVTIKKERPDWKMHSHWGFVHIFGELLYILSSAIVSGRSGVWRRALCLNLVPNIHRVWQFIKTVQRE